MKLCAIQTPLAKGDFAANIASHLDLIDLAKTHVADIVLFPELSVSGYEPELAAALATTADDPRFAVFQHRADEYGMNIAIGVPTRSEHGVHISLVVFRPQQSRLTYSKFHLHADELPYFVTGQAPLALIGSDNDVALAICYELSVPSHAAFAAEHGARAYLVGAVKTASGVDAAEQALSATARRHRMAVLLANCVGESGGYACAGRSAVWSPQGNLLAQLDDRQTGLLIYDTLSDEATCVTP